MGLHGSTEGGMMDSRRSGLRPKDSEESCLCKGLRWETDEGEGTR